MTSDLGYSGRPLVARAEKGPKTDPIPRNVISGLGENPQTDPVRRLKVSFNRTLEQRRADPIYSKEETMADCKLASTMISSYGLVARVVLEEKGVDYERVIIDPAELKSATHLAEVHAFGKVPALYHGDFHLFETAAIIRYVDEAFDGPALQPGDVKDRANMQKWINITGQYIYPAVIGDLVMQRLAPKIGVFGGVTDEAVVTAAVPVIAHQLDMIEQALCADAEYLAGDFSLADIMVATMVQYIGMTPESGQLFGDRSAVSDWVKRVTARPSYDVAAYDLGI